MKYLIVITIILANLQSTFSFGQIDTAHIERPPNGHNSPYRIAFNKLTANTQYYDGQQLEVVGYLNLQFETDALWLNKESYKTGDYKKAIHLKLDEAKFRHIKSLKHHYVIVEGTFYHLDKALGLITLELDVKDLKRLYLKTNSQV